MKILKNHHYGTPFPWPKFYCHPKKLSKTINITFDSSIRYDIGNDQSDVNKLFGFSYGLHHKYSDRIGFRYNKKLDRVEIVLYSYENKKRLTTCSIMFAEIDKPLEITLEVKLNAETKNRTIEAKCGQGINVVTIKKEIKLLNKANWGYTLGLYFGGNRTAPHTITIKENNKK